MDARPSLAVALAEAARMIDGSSSVEDTLTAIAAAAAVSVPDIDEVGISVIHRGGEIETRAATAQSCGTSTACSTNWARDRA